MEFVLDGRRCWISRTGEGEALPLIILLADSDFPRQLEEAFAAAGGGFVLAGFASEYWDTDYTPWPMANPYGKRPPFRGECNRTLAWMVGSFLPRIESMTPILPDSCNRALAGYSLSALFALWTMLETDRFRSIAACSPSLWYEGFVEHMEAKTPMSPRVYLSLGLQEEKGRNPVMKTVGDNTRAVAAWLSAHPAVTETAMVWHEGGHFHDTDLRINQAIRWLAAGFDAR